MTFNTALSGLKAANKYLGVTGNNIANASTTGFKMSRTEFADVYATNIFNSNKNRVGNGVNVASVAQLFNQGNVSSTDRNLDLAIKGKGFFALNDNGSRSYTRSGIFGIDEDGYMVSNTGGRLQGFSANMDGSILQGVLTDLRVTSTTQEPHQSSLVRQPFNVNSSEKVKVESGINTFGNGAGVGSPQFGTTNGYTAGRVLINGQAFDLPSADNLTATQIAAEISTRQGVSASAVTVAELTVPGGVTQYNAAELVINGIAIQAGPTVSGSTIQQQMADEINSKLANVTATVVGGNVRMTSSTGENLIIDTSGGAKSINITGMRVDGDPANPVAAGPAITVDGANPAQQVAAVGGQVLLSLEGQTTFTADPALAPNSNIWNTFVGTPYNNNEFDPTNPDTYNHSTSTTVYDSLGNPHIMTEYFVKEPAGILGPNRWSMYVQIGGQNVGAPSLADPSAGPGLARFALTFNEDGSLDKNRSDEVVITNWTPRNEAGDLAGALGPISAAAGGNTLPLPEPPTSSNIHIDITGSTQYNGSFNVKSLSQNGYAAGSLSELEVSDTGLVRARFTNGQNQILGQVVLASFANNQGLKPLGDTAWAESLDSGAAVIGEAQSGSLGAINSSALEDSNADLSEQLVELIMAQRNYQANAKTIETANAVTQTIINLR